MKLQKIRKARLSDQVVDIIYNKISSGELKAGEKLPSELELSEQLGVSRQSVREALNQLMGLGLIVRGPYTCSVSETSDLTIRSAMIPMLLEDWETRDLFEARRLIECDMTRLVILKACPDDIQELRKINEKLNNDNLSEQQYWDYDLEFHKTIANLALNSVMATINELIFTLYNRYEGKVKQLHDIYRITYNDHKDLIDAIESKDANKACEIINRSFSGSEYALYKLKKNNG